ATNQIALHPIPYYGDFRLQSLRRRKHWIDLDKLKRARSEPSRQLSNACLHKDIHFKADDCLYTLNMSGLKERTFLQLMRDEIGVSVYPTVQTVVERQDI
ncbi:Hypothetical predicted protein, partial [Paramuricea clavata]